MDDWMSIFNLWKCNFSWERRRTYQNVSGDVFRVVGGDKENSGKSSEGIGLNKEEADDWGKLMIIYWLWRWAHFFSFICFLSSHKLRKICGLLDAKTTSIQHFFTTCKAIMCFNLFIFWKAKNSENRCFVCMWVDASWVLMLCVQYC